MKTKTPPKPPSRTAAPVGEVRIIGGQWKRSKLPVPPVPGLRPTPDRVRETLFNWLGQDLSGWRCVDAFAGSGALGFEAASRGAAEVRVFERDRALVAGLQRNAQRLQATTLHIQPGDALASLRALTPGVWDVVFLDPPFGDGHNDALFAQALQAALPLLKPTASSIWKRPVRGQTTSWPPTACAFTATARPVWCITTCWSGARPPPHNLPP